MAPYILNTHPIMIIYGSTSNLMMHPQQLHQEYEGLLKACGIYGTRYYFEKKSYYSIFSIGTCIVELDQIREGLSCLHFDNLIKSYPQVIKAEVFMPPLIPVTANYIQDKFQSWSTKRHLEEAIIMCWIQYLQHVEGT